MSDRLNHAEVIIAELERENEELRDKLAELESEIASRA
jgi:hypothetical protein